MGRRRKSSFLQYLLDASALSRFTCSKKKQVRASKDFAPNQTPGREMNHPRASSCSSPFLTIKPLGLSLQHSVQSAHPGGWRGRVSPVERRAAGWAQPPRPGRGAPGLPQLHRPSWAWRAPWQSSGTSCQPVSLPLWAGWWLTVNCPADSVCPQRRQQSQGGQWGQLSNCSMRAHQPHTKMTPTGMGRPPSQC